MIIIKAFSNLLITGVMISP